MFSTMLRSERLVLVYIYVYTSSDSLLIILLVLNYNLLALDLIACRETKWEGGHGHGVGDDAARDLLKCTPPVHLNMYALDLSFFYLVLSLIYCKAKLVI